MSQSNVITVSSPGRICLFGEHQDYLGLPVVAAAINVRAVFRAVESGSPGLRINMPDTGGFIEIDTDKVQVYESKRDYLKSAVNILLREGFRFDTGYDIELKSDIPISKGCSSSSAMLVAWMGMLSRISDRGGILNLEDCARLAYVAEVKEFGEPGGMMDHFTSAIGGLVRIDTSGGIKVERLDHNFRGVFVLGDSMMKKDTTGVLGSVKTNALGGMEVINKVRSTDWEELDIETAAEILSGSKPGYRKVVTGNIENREITKRALSMFRSGDFDDGEFGEMLLREHRILSESLNISTDRIDDMVQASIDAGAWGAKVNGSGGGGCMFAYSDEDVCKKVAEAIESAGGRAIMVKIDSGIKEEAS
ncbi:MAG TPA: galactokinase family protein [bacterium]|nr:galactokinase family protein [bacterium]